MKATQFEFRFRILIVALIYVIGFWAPWARYGDVPPVMTAWLALSTTLARWRWLPLDQATLLVTVLAVVCAVGGAALRIWGAAHLGPSVVQSPSMQAGQVAVSGPYRFVRNPLYIGTLLFSLGVSILMPPSGAIFFMAAIVVFYLRLILAEEDYLASQLGTAYLEYKQHVPRLLASVRPRMPRVAIHPQWLQACISEIFPAGFALCLAVLSWRYEPHILIRCVLICFGLSLVVRAFVPGQHAAAE